APFVEPAGSVGAATAVAGATATAERRGARVACSTAAVRAWTTSAVRRRYERNIQKPRRATPSARLRLTCACVLRMTPRAFRGQAKISSGTTATSEKMTEAACCRPCCFVLASSAIDPLPCRYSDRGPAPTKDFQRRDGWC